MTSAAAGRRPVGFELLGWALVLAAVAWAYTVHQGMGPSPHGLELRWFEPRRFMLGWSPLAWAFESLPRLLMVLALPSAALTAGVFIASGSSLARGLSLAAGVAVLLFGFYGAAAMRIWQLFFWRGSAVLVVTALALGFALAAPLLARSWLRQGWPLRAVAYLPVAFVVVAFVRNATGTDPSLRYSLSPWPAASLYGIEVGALFVMLVYASAGIACQVIVRAGERRRKMIPLAVGLGLAAPQALLWLCDALGTLPFRVDLGSSIALLVASTVAIAATLLPAVRRPEKLPGRAKGLAVGAALLALPILGGQLWARSDYYWTREHRAREIIDAMERYLDREKIYPDELIQLVEAGDLEELPRPAIGFGFLYDGEFGYRDFGTSYLLEFPAPRWVECAYTPPYEDDEDERHPDPASIPEGGEAGLDEAWSCPDRPPELW